MRREHIAAGAALARLENERRFSGTMLVSQDGAVLFERAFGFASRQLNVPNTLETKFHIASVTKMFIAMLALILYEQGRLSLRERPATYVPELAVLDEGITLHHLLSHTSGLPEIYEAPNLRFAMQRLKAEQGDLLSYLAAQRLVFPPGEGWRYSSTGFILLGYVMERVAGQPFSELMRQYILAPLHMTNSGIDDPRFVNPGRAYGHRVEHGQAINAENDELSIFPELPGELYSTVGDLKKWCDAMFDCPLVSPHTLRSMFTAHATVNPTRQYGYGWYLTPHFRYHGGGTPGFASLIRQYPERKLSVIALFNSDHIEPWQIINPVEQLLLD